MLFIFETNPTYPC